MISIRTKIIVYSVFAIFVLALVSAGVFYDYQNKRMIAGLDGNLKLKAPVDDILSCHDNPSTSGKEPTVTYNYVSGEIVEPAIFQGLKEDISQRTPSALIFLKGEKQISSNKIEKTYVGKFYSGRQFQKKGDKWYQIRTATTTRSAFLKQARPTLLAKIKQIFVQPALADTYYSGAGDGIVINDLSSADRHEWALAHNATAGTADYIATTSLANSQYTSGGVVYEFGRAFLPFNTSAIPGSANVTAATLNVYVTGKYNTADDGTDYIGVVQTTQASSATLADADYDMCGAVSNPTQGATALDITAITTSAYNTFTLNATGVNWVTISGGVSTCGTTAGFTCLGLREGHDITNSEYLSASHNSITFSTSEETAGETGTDQDPYLTVTYIAPAVIKIDGGTVKIDGGTVKINN
jgi:hypothetical protein